MTNSYNDDDLKNIINEVSKLQSFHDEKVVIETLSEIGFEPEISSQAISEIKTEKQQRKIENIIPLEKRISAWTMGFTAMFLITFISTSILFLSMIFKDIHSLENSNYRSSPITEVLKLLKDLKRN